LLLVVLAASGLFGAAGVDRADGTYRGRVITERFLHQQAARTQPETAALRSTHPVLQDQGDIAIVDGGGGVVVRPNGNDVEGRTLRFTPGGEGYSGAAEAVVFDQAAREAGIPLALDDDDAVRVDLPFDFPFFDQSYSSVFVHSDGVVTFEGSDVSSADRSLARAASGPPRLAPMFADLDPSRVAARVRAFLAADRAVITWDGVPEYSSAAIGLRQTFQVEFRADGSVAFHYLTANLRTMVTGVFRGRLAAEVTPVDLSSGFGASAAGGFAESFQFSTSLDCFAAAQAFYLTHDDSYDFLLFFNSFGLSAGPGSFAFEVNVRNDIQGIGDLLSRSPVFDFGREFGSPRRLASFINMGPLSQYPADPFQVIPLIGENSTMSVMGQEVGHRWGAYLDFLDPVTGLRSSSLLGRGRAHWSFFFNSEASVLEGNRIEDLGQNASPRFRTTGTVSQFSPLDEYIMGLRAPEDVPASFLVEQPIISGGSSTGRPPQTGVSFRGQRKEIPLDLIVAAEGPRTPDHTVSEKEFRFAFVLVVPEGTTQVPQAALEQIDQFRRSWGPYFEDAADGLADASTEIVSLLELSAWPAGGVLSGTTGTATVTIARPLAADLTVALSSDSGAIQTPATVVIPAGDTTGGFGITGNAAGVATLTATAGAPGFDQARARIQVNDSPDTLLLEVESGDEQTGAAGESLAEPLVVLVRDANQLPYSGVELAVATTNSSAAETVTTDATGRARIAWTLGEAGEATLTATVVGAAAIGIVANANSAGSRPIFASTGVVNAASFRGDGLAPGALATIFGLNLSAATGAANSLPLPRELSGAEARINGVRTPLIFARPGQLNLQLPFELPVGAATVTVRTGAGSSASRVVTIVDRGPGIFFDQTTGFGILRFSSDGLTAVHRAARPGEGVEVYATGLGSVTPPAETGERSPTFPLSLTTEPVLVEIGGPATLLRIPAFFSGLTPQFSGLYQVNFLVPDDLPAGTYEVVIEIAGVRSNAVRLDVE